MQKNWNFGEVDNPSHNFRVPPFQNKRKTPLHVRPSAVRPSAGPPLIRPKSPHVRLDWKKKHEKKKTEAPQPNPSADCLFPFAGRPVLQPQRSGHRDPATTGEPPDPLPCDLPIPSTKIRPQIRTEPPLPGSLPFAGCSPLSPLWWFSVIRSGRWSHLVRLFGALGILVQPEMVNGDVVGVELWSATWWRGFHGLRRFGCLGRGRGSVVGAGFPSLISLPRSLLFIECFACMWFSCSRLTCQFFIGGQTKPTFCHSRIEVILLYIYSCSERKIILYKKISFLFLKPQNHSKR
jgi:hypothetical protein